MNWNKEILIKYPIDFEIKYVWTPKKNIPTIPLIKLINFAPWYPVDTLRKTGKEFHAFERVFQLYKTSSSPTKKLASFQIRLHKSLNYKQNTKKLLKQKT